MSSETNHWTCPKCSSLLEPQFDICWKCGSDREGNIVGEAREEHVVPKLPKSFELHKEMSWPAPDSRMGWSVSAFILFGPFGLMALIYSVLSEVARIHGDTHKSNAYASVARQWRMRAFTVAFIVYGLMCLPFLLF